MTEDGESTWDTQKHGETWRNYIGFWEPRKDIIVGMIMMKTAVFPSVSRGASTNSVRGLRYDGVPRPEVPWEDWEERGFGWHFFVQWLEHWLQWIVYNIVYNDIMIVVVFVSFTSMDLDDSW